MIRTIVGSAIAVVVLTLIFGFAYPLVMTGFAQVAFKDKANGSLITRDGKVVGSKLAAQGFTSPRHFHERPSATAPPTTPAPRPSRTSGRQIPALAKNVQTAAAAILTLEGPYNPGLVIGDIPVDAVTTSGSGIHPDISPAYAALQARRIAAIRKLPLERVRQLIDGSTDGRSLGFLGEPGVNVLELNLALDREQTA